METLIDDNFLGGKLTILVYSDKRMTIGRLTIYDVYSDDIKDFLVSTTCKDIDIFDINTGIKYVKLKIVKRYYSYIKECEFKKLSQLENAIKQRKQLYDKAMIKLDHINYELSKY